MSVRACVRACICACLCACPARQLTLRTAVSLYPLQLKGSLAPLLLPLLPVPLRALLPTLRALPGHLVGGAVLRAAGGGGGEVGCHAAHGDAPPVGHASDGGHVRQEAAEL